jgi:hypothetical protein
MVMCQIDFHSMRTGSFESLFQSVNELIKEWKLLILSDLNGLYNSAEIYQNEINTLPRVWTPPPPRDPRPPSQPPPPPTTGQPPKPGESPKPVQQRKKGKTKIGGRGQYQTNVNTSAPPPPPPPPPCPPPPCPPPWFHERYHIVSDLNQFLHDRMNKPAYETGWLFVLIVTHLVISQEIAPCFMI